MKALVTGGRGFIGSQIVILLRSLGIEVFTLSRSEISEDWSVISGDIFLPKRMHEILEKIRPNIVIHAAWDTTLTNYVESPENLHYQVASTAFVLDCVTSGVESLIILGSSAEYGLHFAPVYSEVSGASPNSEYGKAKYNLLKSLQELKIHESLNFAWLRIFQPYGPTQGPERLIPTLLSKIKDGSEIILKNPNQVRDWINIKDICSVIEFVMKNNSTGVFDVGTGVGTRNIDLLLLMANILEIDCSNRVAVDKNGPNLNDVLVVHTKSTLFKLGWSPSFDLDSGIREVMRDI